MRLIDFKHLIEAETSGLDVLQYRGHLMPCGSETDFAAGEHKQGVSAHESLNFSLFQSSVTCF